MSSCAGASVESGVASEVTSAPFVSVMSVPSGLAAADGVGLDLLLVAAGEVGPHGVGGQPPALPPLGEVASYVGVERVHEDLVGAQHVTLVLGRGEGVAV